MSGLAPHRSTYPPMTFPFGNGWANVNDYGAIGDGVTNDDAAFALAYASGNNVYIPLLNAAGNFAKYLLSATITPANGQQTWMPFGQTMYEENGKWTAANILSDLYSKNTIIFKGTTNYLFNLSNSKCHCFNVHVTQHPTYPQTAGGHFYTNQTAVWPTVNNQGPILDGCVSNHAYRAFYITGYVSFVDVRNTKAIFPVYSCYEIDCPLPYADHQFLNNNARGLTTTQYGLCIHQCDTSKYHGLKVANCVNPLAILGDTGVVAQIYISHFSMEGGDATAAWNVPIGGYGYTVYRVNLDQVHFLATVNTYGAKVVVGSTCQDCMFNNLAMFGMNYSDAGTRNTLSSSTFKGLTALNLASTAITVSGIDSTVIGTRASSFTVGYALAAGASYATLSGCNLRGATTPATWNATAKTTSRGSANIGITDY